jgi:hypothetical protein
MRSLLTGYAGAFNRRHKRVGHLFQNRYKSIIRDVASFIALCYSLPRDAPSSPPGRPGHSAPCHGAGDRADRHLSG